MLLYKNLFTTLLISFYSFITLSQENKSVSIYFDSDKHLLRNNEEKTLIKFIQRVDMNKVKTIEIFGYCDSPSKDQYYFKLAEKRVNSIKNFFVTQGINKKTFINVEKKSRVLIDLDYSINNSKLKAKDNRIDIILNYKDIPINKQERIYTKLNDSLREGDRIILQNIQFEQGRSRLTSDSKRALKQIAKQLKKQPNLHFEIHGHVCCTSKQHTESYDKDTRKRELSHNRARNVYEYLVQLKIDETKMKYFGCGNQYSLNLIPDLDRRVELLITD